jgi:DNA-binding XRE family transcriptional regulator
MDRQQFQAARVFMGLNQEEFAERLGVTAKTVQSIEQGGNITQSMALAVERLVASYAMGMD